MAKKTTNSINVQNKRARFDYEIAETFTAGLVLKGSEIKSIRDGKVSIAEGFCYISKDEAFIKNMNISEYSHGGYDNHEPNRERKLLLNKREIVKIQKKIGEKGMALVPLKLFIDDNGRAKINIGLGKGKKTYDKRESLKKRDDQLRINRIGKI